MNITNEVMRLTGLAKEELEIERKGRLTWYYNRGTCVLVAQYNGRSGKLMVSEKARVQLAFQCTTLSATTTAYYSLNYQSYQSAINEDFEISIYN